MDIYPVLDLRGGQVVHAVAGQRHRYQPVQSCLTGSTDPVDLLKVMQDRLGLNQFYVADLDGIQNNAPDWKTLVRLSQLSATLLIDAGFRQIDDARRLQSQGLISDAGVRPILGTESFEYLHTLTPEDFDNPVISVDLRAGQLQVADPAIARSVEPLELIRMLADRGFQELIVLDVAAVGTGQGIPTLPLIRSIQNMYAGLRIVSGGGVRSEQCLRDAWRSGLDGLLVASAIHSGSLGRAEFERIRQLES